MTNVYQAPAASLDPATVAHQGFGSVEKGIAGDYEFSIRKIISEAWEKTSGSKGTIWLAILLYIVVFIPVSLIIPFLLDLLGLHAPIPGQGFSTNSIIQMIVSQLLINVVVLPLGAGFMMIGLKRVVGAPVSATEVFGYYHKTLPLFGTLLLMYVMIAIGFCLLVLPGIYLSIAYYMAMPLVIEKNLSPWQALEASRKAITHHWFRIFGLGIVLMLIFMLSMLPLGIGMIWTMPMLMIAYGIIYRNMFGYEGRVAA